MKPRRRSISGTGARRAGFRHDLEQDARGDGDSPENGRLCDASSTTATPTPVAKTVKDDAVGGSVVAVDHGDGDQGERRLHEQHRPFHPVDGRSAQDDTLPSRVERVLERGAISRCATTWPSPLWGEREREPQGVRENRRRDRQGGVLAGHRRPFLGDRLLHVVADELADVRLGLPRKGGAEEHDSAQGAGLSMTAVPARSASFQTWAARKPMSRAKMIANGEGCPGRSP